MIQDEEERFLEVRVRGKNPVLFAAMRLKFLEKAQEMLDTVINFDTNATMRDEAKKFSSELLNYAHETLRKKGYENIKILEEINKMQAESNRQYAEIRKLNAESRAIELKNMISELKLSIGMIKVFAHNENDEASILFMKNIEDFYQFISKCSL